MKWNLVSVVLALAVAGCGKANSYVEPPPPGVTVTFPTQRNVTEYLEFSGMTQPAETVEIRARVKGFLKERHFTEGAEVKQGQLLLVIDEEPFFIQRDAAKTRLREAEAALQQAIVSKAREVAAAQVNVSQAQVQLARQEEIRIRQLYDKKVSTAADLDQASATLKAREAELESAKSNHDQVLATYETSVLSFRAQVEAAQIAVKNAELDLSYCRMTAPINGRISRINVDVGNLVGDGQSTVLATIVKLVPMYAYATISESDLLRTPALKSVGTSTDGTVAEPVPVELGLANQSGFPTAGVIDYSDPGLDPETGTLRMRGVFANSDRTLLPGMFVRMRVPVAEHSKALLVPERALGTDQSGQYVLVVDQEDMVQYRSVQIGVSVGGLRVVDGQLTVNDQVITEGLLRARPGAKVDPQLDPSSAMAVDTAHLSGRR